MSWYVFNVFRLVEDCKTRRDYSLMLLLQIICSSLHRSSQYPDSFFEGLITIEVLLVENQNYIVDFERAVFRVTPWIMTSNSQKPLKVFAVKLTDQNGIVLNNNFLNDLSSACVNDPS